MPSSLLTSDLQHNVSNVVDSSSLNLDKPDTVQTWTSQLSTWTALSSVQVSTDLSLEPMEVAQDSIPGDTIPTARTTSHKNDVQSQIKRKKNKTKNCEVTLNDYLSLTSPSEFLASFNQTTLQSDSEQKIVEKYVKDMMDKGLIHPSKSPCDAPILFACKNGIFAIWDEQRYVEHIVHFY